MSRDLISLQAQADMQLVCDLTLKWSAQSTNPEIGALKQAVVGILAYVTYLEQLHHSFDSIINRTLDEKHTAQKELKELDKIKEELAIANAQLAKFYA